MSGLLGDTRTRLIALAASRVTIPSASPSVGAGAFIVDVPDLAEGAIMAVIATSPAHFNILRTHLEGSGDCTSLGNAAVAECIYGGIPWEQLPTVVVIEESPAFHRVVSTEGPQFRVGRALDMALMPAVAALVRARRMEGDRLGAAPFDQDGSYAVPSRNRFEELLEDAACILGFEPAPSIESLRAAGAASAGRSVG